jgi:hypothetical protein
MNIEALKTLTCQHWNKWFFSTPVPMLSNQTPLEASETVEGRQLIQDLLLFYDSLRDLSAIDPNVPSNYARWKLGYGQGTPAHYVREEALFYFEDSRRPTNRQDSHTKRLKKKTLLIFIPKRCEVVGCDKTDTEDVQNCQYCKCVFYCGREHQKQDWVRHKLDCNAITNLEVNLQVKPFFFTRERIKFPLLRLYNPKLPDPKHCCFICHSTLQEVDLTYTECCRMPVCDNSHEYQIMSYKRDFCQRSHALYTSCATHYEESHEGNWRDCDDCNKLKFGARPFASTNGFCATPCFEKFLPQGSMLTYKCGMLQCNNRMLPGHSAVKYSGSHVYCSRCAGDSDLLI